MAYTPPTILQSHGEIAKIAAKSQQKKVAKLYGWLVGSAAGGALLVALAAVGPRGVVAGAAATLRLMQAKPVFGAVFVVVLFGGLYALLQGVMLWKNPAGKDVRYAPYPPLPDLTDRNDLYIGSGWSLRGKRPGDPIEEEDEPLFGEPHAIIPEKGLFGNIHITGAVGGGKTSTGIMPIMAQAIGKFHPPPPPDPSKLDKNGRFPAVPRQRMRHWRRRQASEQDFRPLPPRRTHEASYAGLTMAEAEAKYLRMVARWRQHKWALFVIDPKGDMTQQIEQIAAYYGREGDVRVLRPGGPWTYNPLNVSDRSLVQAELVLEGVEAVSGQTIQQFWRNVQTEWLGYAIEILKAVDPKRKTFEFVLAMARSEALRTELVARAEQIMRAAQEEEARMRRLGQRYTGPKVDSQAIAFFREFDSEDSDARKKGEVTSGIKAQAKYFTADEMIDFLCPKLPPTFEGFPAMIDKGLIVVLQMPPSEYGPVGRVNGILMMSDAMQAARERILQPQWNQDRVILMLFDEVQNYLNKALKEFLAMNRQSRACVAVSHQSQSQLIQEHDRSAEAAFNDNLRNKIAYQAPNADAAGRLAKTIGQRTTFVQRWTENASMQMVREAQDTDKMAATSVSIAQMETPWFLPEEFIKLGMGEMIVRLWDGTRTHNPRQIEAFPYYKSEIAAGASGMPTRGPAVPHPVVRPSLTRPSDAEYLLTALDNTGYVILLPLTDEDGTLVGWWWTTAAGTIITSLEALEGLGELLIEKLLESPLLFVTPDAEPVRQYFGGHLNADLDRILDPSEVRLDADASPDIRAAHEELLGLRAVVTTTGSWSAVHGTSDAALARLVERGRGLMTAFERLGAWLGSRADEEVEAWIVESTRPRELLRQDAAEDSEAPDTAAATPEPADPTPTPAAPADVAEPQVGAGDAPLEIDPTDALLPAPEDLEIPDWALDAVDSHDTPATTELLEDLPDAPATPADPLAEAPGEDGAGHRATAPGSGAGTDPSETPDLVPPPSGRTGPAAPGAEAADPSPQRPQLRKGAPLD